MSSTSTECNATKHSKSKRGSRNTSARPPHTLDKMMVGTASEPCIPSSSSSPSPSSSSSLPSTSSLALPLLQTAFAGSPPGAGLSFMEQTTPFGGNKGTEQQEIQRKYCGCKTRSVQTCNQWKIAAAAAQVKPHSLNDRSIDAEVVDLTCKTSEPIVVDLTNNDSVVLVGESGQQPNREFRPQPLSDSLVFSGGGGDDSRHTQSGALATRKLPREVGRKDFARSSGTLSCGICIDSYAEIVQSGRLIVSTTCGHIFCSQCLSNFLGHANFCPICRRKLTPKEYHPLYM
ncbi:E3 ubiquitin-protein ligase RNF4-like [Podarcis raffonei]|uniref:E3 ubiquitin-protein ligase RNF4-like n=1 Tax=Podarcis raffonei TaxID=65483 RepID=UPI0023295DBE|nr:E3 ubiquitin-protein ligase RNF4-like [Podarcis raffonei]